MNRTVREARSWSTRPQHEHLLYIKPLSLSIYPISFAIFPVSLLLSATKKRSHQPQHRKTQSIIHDGIKTQYRITPQFPISSSSSLIHNCSVEPTAMVPEKRPPKHTEEEWEGIREIFITLWIDDDLTLREVIDAIATSHNFQAR